MNISADIERGLCCAECTTYFVAAHGRRILCTHCASKLPMLEISKKGCAIATLREKP